MKYIISFLFFFAFLSSLYSCSGNVSAMSQKDDQQSKVTICRFDRDLDDYLKNKSDVNTDTLKARYGDFLNAFGSVTINRSDYNNADFFALLAKYFSNPTLSQIYKDALGIFENTQMYELQLTDADVAIRKYFEGKSLPILGMHISGFKSNIIVLENMISISSDRYLGKNYPLYKNFFEDYQLAQMEPKMIVRDYLKAWLLTELPQNNKRKDLLSVMIDQGKILYALHKLLPDWSEADLIGYTLGQIEWASKNDKNIWATMVNQNYLYSAEYLTIVKFVDDAPYTASISADSPGRLGAWLGWQIVTKFADNVHADLAAVFYENDYQAILKASKYNP